ncbi:hypothetical protein AMTRI_Chr08g160790 [Amborella trichopoda]
MDKNLKLQTLVLHFLNSRLTLPIKPSTPLPNSLMAENRVSMPYTGHLVLFSYPYQGHINPMIQLARTLHSRGFFITIVHTDYNAPHLEPSPGFSIESICLGLSNQEAREMDKVELVLVLNEKCRPPFRALMEDLQSRKGGVPVSCLITDAVMYFTQDLAEELGIKRMAFRTSSSTSTLGFQAIREKGYLDERADTSDELVPDLSPIRFKDLPFVKTKYPDYFSLFISSFTSKSFRASALIFNTSDSLESPALEKIRPQCRGPVYAIGPLNLPSSSSILLEDDKCISWLDTQPPRSVVYTSFGSIAGLDSSQVMEIAWGLANSGRPFLWVVRSDLVNGLNTAGLPSGFMDQVGSCGRVVEWAPQKKVLAHRAVGAFWTHCGWNSTLESICAGVPMACWPQFSDQRVNSRLICHVWGVGAEMRREVERGEVEMVVRRLLEREGEEMRERASELKKVVEKSLGKGGSSYDALESLILQLMSC